MAIRFPLAVVITGQDVSLESTLGKASMRMRATGAVARQLGATLTLGVTAPLVALGAAAIRTGAQVEQNLLGVRAAANLTAQQLEELRRAARGYNDLGAGVGLATEGMLAFAKAGVGASQITAAMRPTIILARLAQQDLGETVQGMVGVLGAYRRSFEDAALVSDQLVVAAERTGNSIGDLFEAFRVGGPIAAATNQRFNDTLAALALIGQNGQKAARGGAIMRAVLADLANITPAAEARLKSLRIDPRELTDGAGQLRSIVEIMELLERRGASTADVMAIFGANAGSALVALLGAGSASVRRLSSELSNAGGAAMRKYQIMTSGAAGAQERLMASLQNLADSVSQSGLLDTFTRVVRRVDDWTRAFDRLSPATKEVAVQVGLAAAVAGPLLSVLGGAARLYETAKALRLIAAANALVGSSAAAATPKVAALGAATTTGAAAGLTRLLGLAGALLFVGGGSPGLRRENQLQRLQALELRAGLPASTRRLDAGGLTTSLSVDAVQQRIVELLARGVDRPKSAEEQRLLVEFRNAPPGMRVDAGSASSIDVDVGYAMMGT